MEKGLPVRKLRSKVYKKVIEVRVPVRFYWVEDGFDGIDFGPLDKRCTTHCYRLLTEILKEIPSFMHPDMPFKLPDVPDAFKKAFNE